MSFDIRPPSATTVGAVRSGSTRRSLAGRGRRSTRLRRGNAYLVTVMVMIIVTLLGLSIGALTQTEMLIGSRQRVNQRVFYVADGGLSLAVSRFMVQAATDAAKVTWDLDPSYDTGVPLKAVVRYAPVVTTADPPCNLCDILETSEYGSTSKANLRKAITVRATIESESGAVVAQRRLSSLIDIQPWDRDAASTLSDSQKAEIEFN